MGSERQENSSEKTLCVGRKDRRIAYNALILYVYNIMFHNGVVIIDIVTCGDKDTNAS